MSGHCAALDAEPFPVMNKRRKKATSKWFEDCRKYRSQGKFQILLINIDLLKI